MTPKSTFAIYLPVVLGPNPLAYEASFVTNAFVLFVRALGKRVFPASPNLSFISPSHPALRDEQRKSISLN